MNNILTIDSSSHILRLALSYQGDRLVKSEEEAEQSHGQILLKKIDALFTSADIRKEELDAIIVTTGPGSFTGLRIGIAAAKGIAVALGIPIVSVNLFELASHKLQFETEEIDVIVPFKKDEFFVVPVFQNCYDLTKLKTITIKNFVEQYQSKNFASFGIDFQTYFEGLAEFDFSEKLLYDASDIDIIGKIKITNEEFEDISLLEPLYIQKSQAEINFELKNKK